MYQPNQFFYVSHFLVFVWGSMKRTYLRIIGLCYGTNPEVTNETRKHIKIMHSFLLHHLHLKDYIG